MSFAFIYKKIYTNVFHLLLFLLSKNLQFRSIVRIQIHSVIIVGMILLLCRLLLHISVDES